MTKAFVLHSGGLDSSVALSMAVMNHGADKVTSVSVDYGQRHRKEMMYADMLCAAISQEIERVTLRIEDMPKSMLTDRHVEVPNVSYAELPSGVSPTYVPFRNGQLLSKVAALASMYDGQSVIYCGMHAEDAERDAYPDCTLHFIGAMSAAIYIGTYHKVRVNAPFLSMSKADIVSLGDELGVPFEMTWSCYKGEDLHCGTCPTCRSRIDAFKIAEVYDPTTYASDMDQAIKNVGEGKPSGLSDDISF
jgi:7-cyano-7-deazaguanine synthase